jgi:hypothetical protein
MSPYSSDHWAWKSSALGVIPGDGTEVRGGIHMNRGRVGEVRKRTDVPLQVRVDLLTVWRALQRKGKS